MGNTWVLYKGERWELDEYRIQTLLVDGKEKRMIFCRYRNDEVIGEDLLAVRGELEKIFDEVIKRRG